MLLITAGTQLDVSGQGLRPVGGFRTARGERQASEQIDRQPKIQTSGAALEEKFERVGYALS